MTPISLMKEEGVMRNCLPSKISYTFTSQQSQGVGPLVVECLSSVADAVNTRHIGEYLPVHPLACKGLFPVNTNHLYNICTMLVQRRRRLTDVVQI